VGLRKNLESLSQDSWRLVEMVPLNVGFERGLLFLNVKEKHHYEVLPRASNLADFCEHVNELSGSIKYE
jgi:hypothetical protein